MEYSRETTPWYLEKHFCLNRKKKKTKLWANASVKTWDATSVGQWEKQTTFNRKSSVPKSVLLVNVTSRCRWRDNGTGNQQTASETAKLRVLVTDPKCFPLSQEIEWLKLRPQIGKSQCYFSNGSTVQCTILAKDNLCMMSTVTEI